MVNLTDQISSVTREIGYRERVYPRWVTGGKMKKELADRELERMRAVLDTLHQVKRERTTLAEGVK